MCADKNVVQSCVFVCKRVDADSRNIAPPRLHQPGKASTQQQARQVLSTRAARTAPQVARSYVVDTKTGISKLDPIRTSYGAAIT